MSFITTIIDIFLHLDQHLAAVITQFGPLTYVIIFLIIFFETGLVATPFLPGDSLLFAAGAFAALGSLSYWSLIGLCLAAAIIGDSVNYLVGFHIGPLVFSRSRIRWFNPRHLQATEKFYAKHGKKTIILARFIPIIRTFAPFAAGIARMQYLTFFLFNVVGGSIWVLLFVTAGYFFGDIPMVQKQFHLVILGIIGVSLLPGIIKIMGAMRHRLKKESPRPTPPL